MLWSPGRLYWGTRMEAGGNWAAAAALATVGIAFITAGVGIATCYFIREGIRAMNKSSDERAADRKQAQASQEAGQRQSREELAEWRRTQEVEQHRARQELAEWRRAQEAWREADERRHEEVMEDSRRRDEEGRRRHEEAMAALRALIERTGGPRPVSAE